MKVDVGIEVMTKAFEIHWGKKRKIVRIVIYIISVIMISLGIWILIRDSGQLFQGYLSVAAGLIAIIIVSLNNRLTRWRLSKHFKQMGEDVYDVDMSFDDDHFYVKTPKTETKIRWNTFIKWKEQNGLILAYRNNAFFHVIPINQFPLDERQRIITLLSNNSAIA